mmetsp:Transcript_206/g.505  ORF Transcript_206/g.505 Transcript_206/m.505 type:complete len:84 (-) Transcript_206:1071-1322(-)
MKHLEFHLFVIAIDKKTTFFTVWSSNTDTTPAPIKIIKRWLSGVMTLAVAFVESKKQDWSTGRHIFGPDCSCSHLSDKESCES